MEKFFDFTEALECMKYGIPVTRIGNDGKKRKYYQDENENIHCVVGEKNHDYILPNNELLTAKNWTYATEDK